MIMKGNGPAASEHIQHGAEIKSQLFLDILFSVATSLLLGQTLSLSLSLSWFSQPCHGRAYTASPTIVMIVVLSLLSLFILSYFLSNFLFDCILVDESGFGGLRKKKIFVSGFGCLKGWSFGGGYVFEMGFCVRV